MVVADGMVTPKTVGGIANVFHSIQRLEEEETLQKKVATDLKPACGPLGYLATDSELGLSREPADSEPQGFFTCDASAHCSFVSPRYRQLCLILPFSHLGFYS